MLLLLRITRDRQRIIFVEDSKFWKDSQNNLFICRRMEFSGKLRKKVSVTIFCLKLEQFKAGKCHDSKPSRIRSLPLTTRQDPWEKAEGPWCLSSLNTPADIPLRTLLLSVMPASPVSSAFLCCWGGGVRRAEKNRRRKVCADIPGTHLLQWLQCAKEEDEKDSPFPEQHNIWWVACVTDCCPLAPEQRTWRY